MVAIPIKSSTQICFIRSRVLRVAILTIFQGIVRFRERGNQYQYLSESGSFVEVHFYRDSLLIDFLAALYAHTEGMESRDFSKSKLVSRYVIQC